MLKEVHDSEDFVSKSAKEAIVTQDEAKNGDNKIDSHESTKEQANNSKQPIYHASWKDMRELRAPKVLEALAASSLRALRYALEIEGIGQVVAVDNDKDSGLLMCTTADMGVLCGNNGEVCYSKYSSYPLKGKYCHEMALRILLACTESHANRYKRYIVPTLTVHMDLYVRVFVRIYSSACEIKNTPLKLSYVYQCVGCDFFHLQSLGRAVAKDTVQFSHKSAVTVERIQYGRAYLVSSMHDQD